MSAVSGALPPADVLVVGGGLAGLRAGVDLADGGCRVLVLEARSRVGGRVFSHRFEDGQIAERGAEFIDGDHVEVLTLADQLGLQRSHRPEPDGATLVDHGGRTMALTGADRADLDRWWMSVAEHPRTTTDALVETIPSRCSPTVRTIIGREARTEFMLPPSEVSLSFAGDVLGRRQWSSAERHRIVGGNDQLAGGLGTRLDDRLLTSSPVAEIDPVTGEVGLVDGRNLRAGVIIAAVPIPALARLLTLPPSFAGLGYGVGGKVSIQLRRRLWRDLGLNGTVLSDRSWGHLWETTDDQPGDGGILTNLAASHDGAVHAALPGASSRMIAEIERLFPGTRGLTASSVTTDWTNDPWSLGTYLCLHPRQMDDWQSRPERIGRVWLAGEHMDDRSGFMEGALRSGRRVAADVLRAL